MVSRDTNDTEYAQRRQRFLAEQGYAYRLVDADRVLGGTDPGQLVAERAPDGTSPPRLRLIQGGG